MTKGTHQSSEYIMSFYRAPSRSIAQQDKQQQQGRFMVFLGCTFLMVRIVETWEHTAWASFETPFTKVISD